MAKVRKFLNLVLACGTLPLCADSIKLWGQLNLIMNNGERNWNTVSMFLFTYVRYRYTYICTSCSKLKVACIFENSLIGVNTSAWTQRHASSHLAQCFERIPSCSCNLTPMRNNRITPNFICKHIMWRRHCELLPRHHDNLSTLFGNTTEGKKMMREDDVLNLSTS